MKKTATAILVATAWISISEFVRNELLFKSYWLEHYQKLGIVFPAEPVNGMVWGIWSLCLALLLFVLSRKFSALETFAIGWFAGFILMWLVIGNLGVLPYGLLVFAVPLSMLEVGLAVMICKRIA